MEVSTTEKRCRNLGPAKSTVKVSVGRQFEDWGCLLLKKLGYRILLRNIRFRRGEVDVVALHPAGYRVVVEVRGRTSLRFKPVEMLTIGKRRRLLQLALVLTRSTRIIHRVEFLELRGRIDFQDDPARMAQFEVGKTKFPFEYRIYRIEN